MYRVSLRINVGHTILHQEKDGLLVSKTIAQVSTTKNLMGHTFVVYFWEGIS